MMKSTVTANHFFKQYVRFAGAHTYLLSGTRNGDVYYFFTKHISRKWLTTDFSSSSNGHVQQLKLAIPAKEWDKLIASGKATKVCSLVELKANYPCYNKKGELYENAGVSFEKWAGEYFCNIKDRAKDSDDFTTGGDIRVNGEEVQVKYGRATFCTLKTIHRLQAEARAKAVA